MCPASFRAGLCEAGAGLACANEKAPRALKFCEALDGGKSVDQFDAREWCETNETYEFLPIVAQALEEVYNLAVKIIVGFDGGWWPIDEYGSRAAEDFAI